MDNDPLSALDLVDPKIQFKLTHVNMTNITQTIQAATKQSKLATCYKCNNDDQLKTG